MHKYLYSVLLLSLYLLVLKSVIFQLYPATYWYLDNLLFFLIVCVANVVLQNACEKVIVGELYCDVPLGLYVIRGENVVLIGELVISSDELICF